MCVCVLLVHPTAKQAMMIFKFRLREVKVYNEVQKLSKSFPHREKHTHTHSLRIS